MILGILMMSQQAAKQTSHKGMEQVIQSQFPMKPKDTNAVSDVRQLYFPKRF
jgi:hypothetical protein